MKRLLLLLAGAALLTTTALRAEVTPADAAPFLGTWRSDSTSQQFTVSLVQGAISFSSFDTSDGEKFEITDTHLKDGVLRVTQRMPSTDRTTHSEFRSTGKDRLEEHYHGSTWKGTMIWQRKG